MVTLVLFWPVANRPIDPKPGFNRVEFEVPKLYELRILGSKHESVTIERIVDGPHPQRRAVRLDKHGQGHVKWLPAGDYFLRGRNRDGPWRRPLVLPGKTEVRTPGVR